MKKLLVAMIALVALMAPIALASPASATTPRVRLAASTATVGVGEAFTFTVTARRAASHQKAVLQRKNGKKWARVAVKYLPRKGRIKHVSFTQALGVAGYVTFRVVLVAKGSYSAARSNYWTEHVITKTPLRFNFNGARGLALRQSTSSSARVANERVAEMTPVPTSNLSIVSSAGLTANAVVSGKVTVQHFLIAPDGRVFVGFSMPVNLNDTSTYSGYGCILAEVDPASGVPTCVDNDLSFWYWGNGFPQIQFDDSGAVYYAGHSRTTANAVLRRYANGTRTDLINENIELGDFLVTNDGTVLISGTTSSTGARWTRRISPAGSLQTLLNSTSSFVRMPDAVNYVMNGSGTYHFTPPSTLEPGGWAGAAPSGCSGFCPAIYRRATTSDDKVFVTTGNQAQIAQIYPTAATVSLATMQDVIQIAAVGPKVLIAGRTASGVNALSSYNPATGIDTALTDAGHEMEAYHLEAIDGTTAMFDGLRFSDNTLVVGQVNLSTGQVTILNSLTSKWEDFQTF